MVVFSTTAFLLLSMVATHALAQAPAPLPVPVPPVTLPTLSLASAVVAVCSVALGILTQMIQTGKFLGQWVTPKSWLPDFTIAATFLGGAVAYLTSQQSLAINGTTVFYATMAGVLDLVSGAAPGLAVHAHVLVPAKLRALRAASVVAKPAETAVSQQGHVRGSIVGLLALLGVMTLVLGPGIVRASKTIDVSPAVEITAVSGAGSELDTQTSTPEPLVAVGLQGCSWFSGSGGTTTTVAGEQIAQCVFEQILQGVNDPGTIATACFNVTSAQVLAILDSILNFYTQPSGDGGVGGMLCGTGAPPVVGANACISPTAVANARAMRTSVAAKMAAGAR